MEKLNNVDYIVIVVYFCLLVALGLYLKKRASASLEDYFLGGRKLPWWALGISGMASYLDITGTVLIVSFLFILGPRGLFIEFRGGAVLVLAIYLLWTGKWHRRSGCMTGAEWMTFRFGEGPGGQFARVAKAVSMVVFTIGMLAYMVKGVGLFLSMFIPISPLYCSIIMIGIATVYTMVSGFYGVVFTDIFQSFIILIAVISVSLMATMQITGQQQLVELAKEVTGNSQWISSVPHWETYMPRGYEAYKHLVIFALFYLMRNIFYGMAEGDDPKYFGARSDRECGTLTFLWTTMMMFRWPMMMGFTVLGLVLVKDMFPDQAVLLQAADMIKDQFASVDKSRWADLVSGIMNHPEKYSQDLVTGLQNLLGGDWQHKLQLLSFEGTVDPERILPAVIMNKIPIGYRGVLLVALIAASMSTFDSSVNKAAGYFTRDIYQRYWRKTAGNSELIYASWGIIIVMVGFGYLMGYYVENINDIWGWIISALGGGLLVPLFLRLYWWRFNGGGFAFGTLVGMVGALLMRVMVPYLVGLSDTWAFVGDERWQFVITLAVGLAGSLLGTYLTKPTDRAVLERFYKITRPFGFWGNLKMTLDPETRRAMIKEHRNDILSVPFMLTWQVTLFMLPMQLIIHSYKAFGYTLLIFIISLAGIYVFWYRNLPPAKEK